MKDTLSAKRPDIEQQRCAYKGYPAHARQLAQYTKAHATRAALALDPALADRMVKAMDLS
jgi:hypothetical protein